LVSLNRTTYLYRAKDPQKDDKLRRRMRELAESKYSWGCPMLHRILKREGLVRNHKKTERLYREEKLSIRRRKKKKITGHLRVEMPAPVDINERWSMDFVSERLWQGRRFRVLTLVDDYSRECLTLEVDTSIGGARVARVLDRLAAMRGLPKYIRVDNGPEFTGQALDEWAYRSGVKLDFIDPGKPTQNAFIESFNGTFRRECLNENWFTSLSEARETIETWRNGYNQERPHSSLNDLTPAEFGNLKRPGLNLALAQ
jgi:putative transposase